MLLFLDVDGPLIPFGATDRPYPVYEAAAVPPRAVADHPLLSRIDPALGPRLAALGCELVWATTWMDRGARRASLCQLPQAVSERNGSGRQQADTDDGVGRA
jgi:hypothetical protein